MPGKKFALEELLGSKGPTVKRVTPLMAENVSL